MKRFILVLSTLLLASISSFSATIYVDANNGDDSYNGNSSSVGNFPNGPKASVTGALDIAQENDNIVLLSGHYQEIAKVTKSVNMIINGSVLINSIHMSSNQKTLNRRPENGNNNKTGEE